MVEYLIKLAILSKKKKITLTVISQIRLSTKDEFSNP